jgi:hypothetical protein
MSNNNEINFTNEDYDFWIFLDIVVKRSNMTMEEININEIYSMYHESKTIGECISVLRCAV